MKSYWIVNNEYVSDAGLIGIHRGYVSRGFDLQDVEVEKLTIHDLHEKAERYKEITGHYPETGNCKIVIEDAPLEIVKILKSRYQTLRDSTYAGEIDQEVIDWIVSRYEEDEISSPRCWMMNVISKESFLERWSEYLWDFSEEFQDWTDEEKSNEIRSCLSSYFSGDAWDFSQQVIASLKFRFAENESLVLSYSLVNLTFPETPEIEWLRYYIDDLELINSYEGNGDLICDTAYLTNEQLLNLINDL